MTGLSVLYTQQAKKEADWAAVPERDRVQRLREVYWAGRVKPDSDSGSLFSANFNWSPNRSELLGRPDPPGDGFLHWVEISTRAEHRFEWVEVTEVFTTTRAIEIEGAMRAWNGIAGRHPVDFDEFRRCLGMGRPPRAWQRRAADMVVAQAERKLRKESYQGLLGQYGYGTLVVGLPLWFAVLPEDPWRPENALDDFFTRTMLGLEELRQRVLRERACPFRRVIVAWDTSPEALREWNRGKSKAYDDPGNAGMSFSLPFSDLAPLLSDSLSEATSELGIADCESPSMSLVVSVTCEKKRSGGGPWPEMVTVLGRLVRKLNEKRRPMGERLKFWVGVTLCRLIWFRRVHGEGALGRWIGLKLSIPRAVKVVTLRNRARLLYRESRKRDEVRRAGLNKR